MKSESRLTKRGFLREAWKLAWPYWRSDEKWSAAGLLAAVIVLNLVAVWINVRLNLWNKDFYDALQEYDWQAFWHQLGIFTLIAAAWIAVAVYQLYLRQILQIRWRRWLTDRSLRGWLDNQAYYRIQIDQSTTDNPDQRIADDLDSYTTLSLSLSLGMLNSLVTLVSFLFILWTLSGPLTIPLWGSASLTIPGYLVFAAFIYAALGTWRPPAGQFDVRPAALRGRFPLQPGAAARACGKRRVLRRRGA
jgi:putative ATP-binding cassette transporter